MLLSKEGDEVADYVITKDGNIHRVATLRHADKRDHKYIAKIKRSNGKFRYFYDNDEYQRYLRGQKAVNHIKNIFNSAGNAIAKAAKSVKKASQSTISNIDKVLDKVKSVKIKDIATDRIEQGKAFVSEICKGNERPHKYIAKVKLANGKYRYFYKQSEYDAYLMRAKYQESEPDFMKNVPELDSDTYPTREEHMADINEELAKLEQWGEEQQAKGVTKLDETNPEHVAMTEEYIKRSMNCMYCTTAYELRQRGYDVQAADYIDETYNGNFGTYDDWYENPELNYVDTMGGTTNVNKYVDGNGQIDEQKMVNDGVYASERGYSGEDIRKALEKKNPPNSRGNICVSWKGGGGHSMAYETDANGKATIIDCQTNEYVNFDKLAQSSTDVYFVRTDHLELKKGVLEAVEKN